MSKYWVDLTTADFTRLPPETVALLPVAAVEQHGPHLPVGTDTMINRGIVAEALEILGPDGPVLVLPEQAVGTSFEHEAYPGTLSHEAIALMGIWTAIFDSVRASGIRRALLFNSHGGQAALLQPTAVALRRRGMLAAYTSWFWSDLPRQHFPEEEWRFGYHGGAIETAMMLHLRPDLVVTSEIRDFPSTAQGNSGLGAAPRRRSGRRLRSPASAGSARTSILMARWATPGLPRPRSARRWSGMPRRASPALSTK